MAKKIIAAVLVVILILAGCSGNNDVENQTPLEDNNDIVESEVIEEEILEPEPEVTPEPEPSVESVPDENEKKESSVETEPEKDEKKEPPKETSNVIRDQQAEQARQETAGKFIYPPGTSTAGLSERDIKQGVYYVVGTGEKFDQDGNYRGIYMGAVPDKNIITEDESQAVGDANEEKAKEIYDGTGEGSDTSNFN